MRPDSTAVLRLEGLVVGYGRQRVAGPIEATWRGGKLHALVGPNGSGKTTLVRTILRLQRPLGGRVSLDPDLERAYVPQQGVLDRDFPITVAEVVGMGAPRDAGRGRRRQLTEESLAAVGLGPRMRSPFSVLSGGQRQRVLVARALASGAGLVILDEPTSGVDAASGESLWRLLQTMAREPSRLMMVVTHDLGRLARFAATEALLDEGHLSCLAA